MKIDEFCARVGLTRRQVHYYVTIGVFPAPQGPDCFATYGREHVRLAEELRQIKEDRASLRELAERRVLTGRLRL